MSDICSVSSTDYFTGKVLSAGFYILIFVSSREKEVMGYDILEENGTSQNQKYPYKTNPAGDFKNTFGNDQDASEE